MDDPSRPRRERCPSCGLLKYPWNDCASCMPAGGERRVRVVDPASTDGFDEALSVLRGIAKYVIAPVLCLMLFWGFCTSIFQASSQAEADRREQARTEQARQARQAQIQERADRAYREWRERCEKLERYLTPAERAVIADEKDRWDSIERAGRAGRRLGEALRER